MSHSRYVRLFLHWFDFLPGLDPSSIFERVAGPLLIITCSLGTVSAPAIRDVVYHIAGQVVLAPVLECQLDLLGRLIRL